MGRPSPRREPSTERSERSLSPRVMSSSIAIRNWYIAHCNVMSREKSAPWSHLKHLIAKDLNRDSCATQAGGALASQSRVAGTSYTGGCAKGPAPALHSSCENLAGEFTQEEHAS